jgi:phosphoribosyl-ATP pyrophosphohydrolase
MIFNELYNTLEQRKVEYKEEKTSSNTSYTAKLLHEWIDAILKKIWEESIEIIIWAKKWDKENMIYEISDFLYFLNVLMIHTEILPSQIANELSRRFWISGIEEKNSRNSIHE